MYHFIVSSPELHIKIDASPSVIAPCKAVLGQAPSTSITLIESSRSPACCRYEEARLEEKCDGISSGQAVMV